MQYAKPKVYWLMLIGVIFSILNTSTSYAAPICPSGDKMYYVGANAPSRSTRLALSWTAGSTSKTFNFTDGTGTTMTVSFPLLVDRNSNQGGTPPFYGSITDATQNALNLVHNSPAIKDNHTMTISVNRAVTRLGFVVQDLDSVRSGLILPQVPYQERVDVSSTGGQLTYNSDYHTINPNNNIVTAIIGRNCDLNGCNIDATWGAKPANSTFSITHSNQYTNDNSPHAVGYSDFYFCVTPPKLTTIKVLTGNRVETNDQFTIATTTGTTPVSSFTTTGTGSSLTTNSITAKGLSTTATYTIAETIANTDGKGNLANYSTSYACTNANSSSATTMPSGSTTSFNLPTLTYGDDITCTITNTPSAYIFSGIIFNDNGGLTLTERQLTGTNTQYFNGVYDPTAGETGISQTGLIINLAKNCNTATPTVIKTANVTTSGADIGKYSITATPTEMAGATNVCLIQREPNGNLTSYPVDTTNNQANITFASTTYDYQNINFGEVSQNNAGLVLVKEQATNDCDISIATMLGLNYVSTQQDAIDARKCVAYKITAYNRTNLTNGLTDVKITDALPKKGVNGSTVNSLLDNPLDTTLTNFKVDTANSVAIGANGTVVSDVQSLAKGASRSLYFNTKYDSSLP